jgi:hypothetical protein
MSIPLTGGDPDRFESLKRLSPRILSYLRTRVLREIAEGALDDEETAEAKQCLDLYDYGGNSEEVIIETMLDFLGQFEEC